MDPKIPSSIWSRRELEDAPPEVLLAVLWLYTQPRVSIVGFGEVSLRTFVFETKLPPEALGKAFEALGKGLVRASADDRTGYWLRDAIAHNFGRGSSLGASHMAHALLKETEGLGRAWVALAIRTEYPELADRWDLIHAQKGLGRASATAGVQEQSRAEQSRAEQSRAEDRGAGERRPRRAAPTAAARPATAAEVLAYAHEQGLGMSEAEAGKFFDHFEANGWRQGGKTPLRSWQAAARNWARRNGTFPPSKISPSPADLTGGAQEVI
jgi:hypothetical protein